jgi:hypothetical protein
MHRDLGVVGGGRRLPRRLHDQETRWCARRHRRRSAPAGTHRAAARRVGRTAWPANPPPPTHPHRLRRTDQHPEPITAASSGPPRGSTTSVQHWRRIKPPRSRGEDAPRTRQADRSGTAEDRRRRWPAVSGVFFGNPHGVDSFDLNDTHSYLLIAANGWPDKQRTSRSPCSAPGRQRLRTPPSRFWPTSAPLAAPPRTTRVPARGGCGCTAWSSAPPAILTTRGNLAHWPGGGRGCGRRRRQRGQPVLREAHGGP